MPTEMRSHNLEHKKNLNLNTMENASPWKLLLYIEENSLDFLTEYGLIFAKDLLIAAHLLSYSHGW